MNWDDVDIALKELSETTNLRLSDYAFLPVVLKLFVLCKDVAQSDKLTALLFRAVVQVLGIAKI